MRTCRRNLSSEFATRICCGYLPREFATRIYRQNLPQELAVELCRKNLPQNIAAKICSVFFVFESKCFIVNVSKSYLYERKPFLNVNKNFLFVRFSLLTVFLFVIAVVVTGHRINDNLNLCVWELVLLNRILFKDILR